HSLPVQRPPASTHSGHPSGPPVASAHLSKVCPIQSTNRSELPPQGPEVRPAVTALRDHHTAVEPWRTSMIARRFMTAVATLGLAGSAALVSAPSASAHGWDQSATGTRSLAAVLAKDGS